MSGLRRTGPGNLNTCLLRPLTRVDEAARFWHVTSTSWTGNVRSALGSWEFSGALRISGKGLQSPASDCSRVAASKLPFQNVVRAIRLIRTQTLDSDWARHQIGQLH